MIYTDRQQKFYVQIEILSQSTSVTTMEKDNLERAKRWLDRGDDFHVVINSLCLGFQSLSTERLQGELSPPVKKLYEDLINAYGNPVDEHVKIVGPTVGTDRGISRSFIFGGIGALIFILLLISTMYLSLIIKKFGEGGAILFYVVGVIIAVLVIIIPGKKKHST